MSDTFKRIADLSREEKQALLAELLRKKADESRAWSPLSHNQRALWFLHQLAPESAAYNLMYAARARFSLDISALQSSVQALVRRHPILTATFTLQNGEPIQRFHPDQRVHFDVIDASTWSREALNHRLRQEGERPFDLERGPVLRVNLFMRSAQDYILVLAVHHIAVDFWSLDIVIDELYMLYAAETAGVKAELALPGLQYTDYVRWQTEMLASPEGERLWAYWKQELAGDLPLLHLPTDRPRPAVQTYRGAIYTFKLEEALSRRLKALASAEKATLYTILLAAFQVLLFRYADQEDILIGTPAMGRSRADLERIVGYLANPVLVRTNLSGNPTFRELLHQVRRKVIEAIEHQDYPFPLLVERLQPKRDPSYSPLFQTMFIWDKPRNFENAGTVRLDENEMPVVATQTSQFGQEATQMAQGSLDLELFALGQQGAPVDLSLTLFEIAGALSVEFRYNVDLFDTTTIARMGQHFQNLLEGIVASPGQHLSDLPLLTEAEQDQILVKWNNTQSNYPADKCIHQLFELQVQQTPETAAVVFEGEKLTYRELNSQANRLAHTLQASGVGPDVLVGVCMERSLEMVVALLGILKAGGAYVPLDPTYPEERLAYMVQDAQMPVLLTQTRLQGRVSNDGMQVIYLDTDNVTASLVSSSASNQENLVSNVQPNNLIYVIYTSGSTGRPKGVMNIHQGVCNRLYWMQQTYQLTTADRVLQKTPFSFDVSVWEFFWPLLTGACLIMARPGGHQDTTYLVSLIAEQQITTLHFVPSMLQMFLQEQKLERCKSLKRVICSGEALPVELQERFFSRLDARLDNLYGPTEASIDVTYWECQRESYQWLVPIGRPIANTHIYILDRSLHPVPVGVAGELYIGGVGLARGYFNRPELTDEKFVANPFNAETGERLFRTGDLARYRPDGAIEFLGRIDHQVKVRGVRIELGEIEAVLAQHPASKEVVVAAREDAADRGPANKRLVAYLVLAQGNSRQSVGEKSASSSEQFLSTRQGTHLSVEELRDYLKEKLPLDMIPSAFVFLDTLPLTPNGKVDRMALPAPGTARPELARAFVAPRNPIEELLAKIWARVLGVDKVGIHDNYFDLGGASIQGLQIVTKANEEGLQLTPEMLFEHQTIAELAAVASRKPVSQISAAHEDAVPTTEPEISGSNQPFQTTLDNTIIESIGVYLPPKVVSTQEVLQDCKTPLRFPLEHFTGINTRRMAGETEFAVDLAKNAVADCLANSKYTPLDIDLLICCNISRCDGPHFRFSFEPSTSIRLQRHFGFTNALVFDVSNACTGLFTGAYIIDAFIKAGLIQRGMAVSGEYISHLTLTAQKEIDGYMDSRLACLTVGDAGAAMILEKSPGNTVGFHEFEMFTLGRYYHYCIAKATEEEHGGAIMFTDSIKVSSVNIQHAVAHAAHIIDRSGWPLESFQHVIMHQTSTMTIRDASREINSFFNKEVCHEGNVIYNLADRGNTATTTHIVALMDHILSNKINSGENAVFGITGSGATIGTALYTFDDLPDRLRKAKLHGQKPVKVAATQEKTALSFSPALSMPRIRIESIGTLLGGMQVEKKTLELATTATEECFAMSSYSQSDIDLLIYAGVYRDDFLCEPAIAAIVAGMQKINDAIESPQQKRTFAFDLFNGALGFLNACHVAVGMIKAKKVKSVMVVASEIENNIGTLPTELRGVMETGSAVILDESADGMTGFGNFVFRYFTDHIEAFASYAMSRNGRARMYFERDPHIEAYYLQCICETVDELLRIEQLDMSQIKVLLPSQISPNFIAQLSDKMHLSRDKFVDIALECKDLFTSSLAYTLQYVREQNLVQPGDIGLIINVGTGIQVGCATYYF